MQSITVVITSLSLTHTRTLSLSLSLSIYFFIYIQRDIVFVSLVFHLKKRPVFSLFVELFEFKMERDFMGLAVKLESSEEAIDAGSYAS